MHTLNARQERFCREYVTDYNGTQAAIRAGYSVKTANEQAAQLLAKLSIQEHIAQLQKQVTKRLCLSEDRVIQELVRIQERALEVRAYPSAIRALELIGKHIGMWTERAVDGDAESITIIEDM
ncbi:MAG: terminase small subunit [Oscillospiraceae bacterium]|jgi:phage terminase small subunit|nr:terminase small subunit [Oscillospiraceae bacterium]